MPAPRLVREDAQTRKGKGSFGMASLHPSYLSQSSRPLWRRILLSLGVGERRRGGYVKPSASTRTKLPGRITAWIGRDDPPLITADTNSCLRLGNQLAGVIFQTRQGRESKPIVRISFGCETEAPGGNGANPAAFADCDDWGFDRAFR
jgi:hypothetical protein